MRKITNLDAAGSSLMSESVRRGMLSYMDDEFQMGGYLSNQINRERVDHYYVAASKLLNCQSNEVAFVPSTVFALNQVLSSIDFNEGDEIIVSPYEYIGNYCQYLRLVERYQVSIVFLELNSELLVCTESLKRCLSDRTRIVSITHVPCNLGVANDIETIGNVLITFPDVLFIVDAAQSIGLLPLDIKKIQCHVLMGSGRKFLRGPRGGGYFLYLNLS